MKWAVSTFWVDFNTNHFLKLLAKRRNLGVLNGWRVICIRNIFRSNFFEALDDVFAGPTVKWGLLFFAPVPRRIGRKALCASALRLY